MKKYVLGFFACLGMCLFASGANAEAEIYRWIDPVTGQTRYSDLPPPGNVKGVVRTKPRNTRQEREEREAEQQLSYAMSEASRKYPVVLYTTPDSDFSNQARNLLNKRGIPFRENEIRTEDDLTAMKNLTGDTTLPTLYVGRQSVRGFESDAYNKALDLAGYPKPREKKQPEAAGTGEGS